MLLYRSLAISLTIVLVITRSQAGGFAIRKADNWDSTTDLDIGESSLLAVKYDLKSTTDFKAPDSSHTKGETGGRVISDFSTVNDVTAPVPVELYETTQQEENQFSEDETNKTDPSTDLATSTLDSNKEMNDSSASIKIENKPTSPMIIENSKGELNLTKINQNDIETTEIPTSFRNTRNFDGSSSDVISTDTINSESPSGDNVSSATINSESPSGDNVSSATINSDSPSSAIIFTNTTKPEESSFDDVTTNTAKPEEPTSDIVYTNITKPEQPSSDTVSTNTTEQVDPSSDIVSTELLNINNFTQSLEYNGTQFNTAIYENSTETTIDITPKTDSLLADHETNSESSKTEINNANTTETLPSTTKIASIRDDLETSTEVNTNTVPSSGTDQIITDITFNESSDSTTDNREITTINTASDPTGMYIEDIYSATTEAQTGETFNTETLSEEISTTILPHWKVYKTINRKRPTTTSVEDTTTSELEMTKSETARFSLERVLNNTPIPSLEELKNDLLNAQDYSIKMLDKINASDSKTEVKNQTSKLEIVSTKRAGYLDNKETTTLEPPQLVTAVMYEDKEIANDTENFGTMYESEVGEGEVGYLPDIRNATGAESQSQLVEDAIKEELLMEKTLSENNLMKEEARQRDSRPVTDNRSGPGELTTPEIITEDLLSVKPISSDKRKTNSIYVTSAVTYKPLKKLDVQHPKQFIRDPDDNSWRNESISSLGIVFKPKNASKSFTEVLKNKTTELSNIVEKVDKSNVPDLRVRLEKIAEVRKSKKKRINKDGDTVYSDYEENSSENANTSKEDTTSPIVTSQKEDISATTPFTPSKTETDLTVNAIWKDKTNYVKDDSTTEKLKKFYNLADYYDATDDYDADYVTLSKIDLKRFTVPLKSGKDSYSATHPPDTYATRPVELTTKPMSITYMPDRQPTIQYFPPTKKVTTPASQKINVNDYDDRFNKKLSMFAFKDTPKMGYDVTFATPPPHTKKFEQPTILTPKPMYTSTYQVEKNLYLTTRPHATEPEPQGGFVPNDGSFNRASYVIKHYKDFINDAAKADDDKGSEYLPYTETPMRGVTMSEIPNLTLQKESKHVEDYDYDTNFKKDIMTRFVDNFNQNSERFKVDFPILYNNSVVHRKGEPNGKVLASSSAFMKRLYETTNPRSQFLLNVKPCNANCEAMTVDLSPAYELHYYVPDQEEKEEIETRPNTLPYRTYRL